MYLNSVIGEFQGISLGQMDSVKLMNRTDRKYWFKLSMLSEVLALIKDDYYLLEIQGQRNLPYATSYYDTPSNEMYHNHHRGKKNRYKIRRRNYVSTNSSFLEIKFKSNKGRTIKQRIASEYTPNEFNSTDENFIKTSSPYSSDDLQLVLTNNFSRLMLVSKNLNERCTIDSNLSFSDDSSHTDLNDLVVVEVKTNGREHSQIIDIMTHLRVKSSGFSKYCIGRSLMQQDKLKINRFKKKHRQINKNLDLR